MTPGRLLRGLLRGLLQGLWWALRASVQMTLVTLALLLAGLWLWSGTQASLDWAWRQWAQPRGFVAEGLSGSLREGLRARRLQVRAGAMHLELQDLALAWDPVYLIDRRVRITGLRASQVRLLSQAAHGDASRVLQALPASLMLPIDLSIDLLAIDRFEWAGRLPLQAHDISARYRYDAGRGEHRLALARVSVASGRYHGEATLADRAPFVLEGWLRGEVQALAPGSPQVLHLAAQAQARGTLADIGLQLSLGLADAMQAAPGEARPVARLGARLTPWRAPFVAQAHAHLQGIDLAALWPQAPHTLLAGRVDIDPRGTGRWRLQADLRNALPGPWDRRRLPLSRLQGEGEWREGLAWVRRLQAQIGAGGRGGQVTGQGQWLAPRGWQLDLRLARVDLQALHGALGAGDTSSWLDGEVRVRSRPAGIDLEGQAQGRARLGAGELVFELAARARRGAEAQARWQANVHQLRLALATQAAPAHAWSLRLQAPVTLHEEAAARWVLGPGAAALSSPARGGEARVAWDPMRWGGGELHASGRVTELPLSWGVLAGRGPPPGDMVFEANWDLHLAHTLRVSARLTRVRGDITLLAENAQGQPLRVTAGVREASLAMESRGEALELALRWASERAGSVHGRLSTRLARGGPVGWLWPAQAPVSGELQARLPRIATWSAWAPPGWRLRGSLAADLRVQGTRATPWLSGPLHADDLALRSVVDGIALEGGRLRAHMDNRRVVIEELSWRSVDPALRPNGGGTLRASGEAGWGRLAPDSPSGLYARLDAQLDRLRASTRSDRQVTVSGTASAWLDPARLSLRGVLRVDRARITIPDRPVPRLGDDVRVEPPPPGAARVWRREMQTDGRALDLDLHIDLGRDARVSGRGVDTGLQGALHLTGQAFMQPRVIGTVSAVDGRYQGYGQRLDLRRGVLRFTGPYDDPALDVIAVRPDLDRAVGVQVTGRAQAPVFRLWSQEPATEAETLSWLVLGRDAAAGGAETLLLEQAALSLLARRASLGTGGLAAAFGLDELAVRREGEQGAAITLGKRLARNLYAAYERSLAGALGTLQVFYDLSARLTLRAEAGDRSGVDLVYALSYDRLGGPTQPAQVRPLPRR